MVDPGLLVGGDHSDPLFSELLNDEPVGVDDAEYRQMRTITSEEERWITALSEDAPELRAVLTKARKHAKTTNTILNKKLSKGIRYPNRRVTPSTRLYSKQRGRSDARIEPFVTMPSGARVPVNVVCPTYASNS